MIYLFNPELRIIEQNKNCLKVESMSGRNVLLIIGILIAFKDGFSLKAFSLMILLSIVFSYSEVWNFNILNKLATKSIYLFGSKIYSKDITYDQIVMLHFRKTPTQNQTVWELIFEMSNGQNQRITTRISKSKLDFVLKTIKIFLPESIIIKYQPE